MRKILTAHSIVRKIKKRLLKERGNFSKLALASVIAKDEPATHSYCIAQEKWSKLLNVDYHKIQIKSGVSFKEALKIIEDLNSKDFQGIIINKPLPREWDEFSLLERIDVRKDIEGLNPYNLGRVFFNKAIFVPPTVLSVLELLNLSKCEVYGKNIVIVGFSNILGKPLSIILADRLATVSVTHIGTFEAKRLPFYVSNADILITAVGKPHFIKGSWIKEGAIVIDVGIGKLKGKLAGDVEFKEACKRASFITPVPGGVGVLTVVFLFSNLLKAAKFQEKDS